MNIKEKVNLIILFLNKEDKFEKENLFFIPNIKIKSISDYDENTYVLDKVKTILEGNFYKDIIPINFEGFIPLTGYEFHFKSFNYLDYSLSYHCYYMVTKDNFEMIKNNFLNNIIDNYTKQMNAKLEECNKIKSDINVLKQF